jgi:Fe-S cluster assembly scaffold protein SufB
VLRDLIFSESKMKFDLFNEAGSFSTKSKLITLSRNGKRQYAENEFSPFEERLSGFVRQNSKETIVVKVPDRTNAKLNLLLLGYGSTLPLQVLVEVGDGSTLDLFEWFGSASAGSQTVAPFHVIKVGKNSSVEASMLHNESASTTVGAMNIANVLDCSSLKMNFVYCGGAVTKSTTIAEAKGAGSSVLANEIVLGSAAQKFDINTFMLNSNRSTNAVLNSGAVLKGRSQCTFKGYASVAKDAAGSSSNVEERAMVADPEARMHSLPDMAIACKDVALASHSSATAPLDSEAIFYLNSRGVDNERARRMLIASFLSRYLADVGNDIVKEIAISILLDKLDRGTNSQVPAISAKSMWIVPKRVKA